MATVSDSEWKLIQHPSGQSYHEYTKPLIKSYLDDRDYRAIQLENGLQALLIHDPNADMTAASLDVGVGHLDDPDDMPGLAHFCEHLLFMGTEQYPKENEYSEYLSKWSGGSNAYTSSSNTNYYFHVAPNGLAGALERFAGFFHSPLFSPSCTTRELNAVDSEHKKNHQTDLWRIFQLNKHLSRPGHPWSKFGSGNRSSLSKAAQVLKAQGNLSFTTETPNLSAPSPIASRSVSPAPSNASGSEAEADGGFVGQETRRRLLEWWNREYSANRMNLCVLGKMPLDQLADIVVSNFSPIRNHNAPPVPRITDHPFGEDEKGTLVSVSTILSFHAIEISFPLEYQAPLWKYRPASFLSHFLGHEGPGSLFSYLKNKHWATSLSSGPQSLAHGFATMKVTVHLTPQGFENYRHIIHAVFQYLSLLRDAEIDDFHYREVSTLSRIKFKFAEKRRAEDYVTGLAERMCWPLPRDQLLAGPAIGHEWESDADKVEGINKIKEYLNSFRIQEGRVVLMAKKEELSKVLPDAKWQKEPWYGTEFDLRRFDVDFVKSCNAPNTISELFLPGPNEFIPTDLSVDKKDVAKFIERPHLIRETALSSLWYKKDDRFWVPKSHVYFDIRSPFANDSPRAAVLTKLYVDVVSDGLTEYSYDAELAGLTYTLGSVSTGLSFSVTGYSDKLSHLVKHILEKMNTLKVDPQRLAVLKEQARRNWENFFLGQSYSLADYYGRYALSAQQWTHEERLREIGSVTPEEVEEHAKKLLSEVKIRALVSGNIYKDEAIRLAELVEAGLGAVSLSHTELNERGLILPEGSNFVWSGPVFNMNEQNSALMYYTQIGPNDIENRVTASLLIQIISEPAFNILRTREQLGYVIWCTNMLVPGFTYRGIRILVQSERSPTYLEARVEAFLDEMKAKLETMSDDEFKDHQNSLKKKWLEADKNLAEEAARFYAQLSTWQLDFLRHQHDAAFVDSLSKADVLRMFMERVHPSSLSRSKLSIHMVSQKSQPKALSTAAITAFEGLVREHFPNLDATAWRTAIDTPTPNVVQFGQYWLQHLNSDAGKQILMGLPALMQNFPAEGEEDNVKGATYIKDLKEFRQSLAVAPDPGPVVEWNDLPVAKI